MANSKNTPKEPTETRLDDHLDAPSITAPGDGPADTTDPNERAASVTPDKAAAAKAGHGTVNAVVPVGDPSRPGTDARAARIEKYKATKPDGTEVTVERNVETGESKVAG